MTRIRTSRMVIWVVSLSLFLTRPKSIDCALTSSATVTTSIFSPVSASTIPDPSEVFELLPSYTPSAETFFGFYNSTLNHCPGPLIPNIHNLNISTCLGPCCIKCPAWESFYEPNIIQQILLVIYVVHQISLACKIFLVISYLVLPGRRGQPHTSVLLLFISTSMWFASFNIMPGISNACVNDFEISTAQNSRTCGVQGVFVIYFIHTTVLWCSLLVYKLHLLAVWRSDIVERYFGWVAAFCWIFPLIFAVPLAVKGLAQFSGVGASCLVSHANLNTYLFYPVAAYIYPALLLHLVTATKMIHVALVSSQMDGNDGGLSELCLDSRPKYASRVQFKRILRGQWRPALMLTLITCNITFFWLFFFLESQRKIRYNPKAPWIDGWLDCLLDNDAAGATPFETQTTCAKRIASHRPSTILFTIVEMLVASSGIGITLIFTAKADFWADWISLLHNSRGHGAFKSWMERRRRRSSTYPIMQSYERDLHPHQFYGSKSRKGSPDGYSDVLPAASDMDVMKEHGDAPRHSNDRQTAGHQQRPTHISGGLTSSAKPSLSKMDPTAIPITECLSSPEKAFRTVKSPSYECGKQGILPLAVPRPSNKPKEPQMIQQTICSSQLPTLALDSLPLPVLFAFPSPPPTCPLPPKPQSEYFPSVNLATRPSAPRPARPRARSHSSGNSDKIMLATCRSIKGATGKHPDKARIKSLDPKIITPMPPTIPSKHPARAQSYTSHKTSPPLYPPPSPPQS